MSDRGFGPEIVVADVLGGERQVLISLPATSFSSSTVVPEG